MNLSDSASFPIRGQPTRKRALIDMAPIPDDAPNKRLSPPQQIISVDTIESRASGIARRHRERRNAIRQSDLESGRHVHTPPHDGALRQSGEDYMARLAEFQAMESKRFGSRHYSSSKSEDEVRVSTPNELPSTPEEYCDSPMVHCEDGFQRWDKFEEDLEGTASSDVEDETFANMFEHPTREGDEVDKPLEFMGLGSYENQGTDAQPTTARWLSLLTKGPDSSSELFESFDSLRNETDVDEKPIPTSSSPQSDESPVEPTMRHQTFSRETAQAEQKLKLLKTNLHRSPGQSVKALENTEAAEGATSTTQNSLMGPLALRSQFAAASPSAGVKQAAAMAVVKDQVLRLLHKTPGVESDVQSSHPSIANCNNCGEAGHHVSKCKVVKPSFHKFMLLAPELRERIYEFTLASDQPIKPHLCDSTEGVKVKFHDDNQPQQHNATSKLLGITRVSKQIRNESLAIFYSANTFQVGKDTTSYFDHLSHRGRFHLIRHVRFSLDMRGEDKAAGILRRMNQYLKEADVFEKSLTAPIGSQYTSLAKHPQYITGGLQDINTLIALRKLTSALPESAEKGGGVYTSKLIIPVPSAHRFTTHPRLKWFPTVLHGLGISLHFVENILLTSSDNGLVSITWHQRFQKKSFAGKEGREVVRYVAGGQTEVYTRALALDPGLESRGRPRRWCYMRFDCGGRMKRWEDVETEGGGIF